MTDKSRKQQLIEECNKHNVCVFIDDSTESSSGIYSKIRATASEAELERRLNQFKTVQFSQKANRNSWIAIAISAIALIVTIVKDFIIQNIDYLISKF